MKKVVIPIVFLFAIALSSCKTGTTSENQENVDSLKQVEDVIQEVNIDTVSTEADTLEVKSDSSLAN
ncbi:MAG: hypothetical protein JXB49_18415 [Bacteroidales bacterium]|nr:hypothetical protein [Bacteroidales bacterium]MBN2820777.1 hypothetical protein [Bacteroidales bacterium]